jgi:hypothetical protein
MGISTDCSVMHTNLDANSTTTANNNNNNNSITGKLIVVDILK